jgi:integrase
MAILSKRNADSAQPGARPYFLHDKDLPGFSMRVHPSGRKAFIVRYRIGGGRGAKERQITLGTYGVLTIETARRKAKTMLADAKLGRDPAGDLRPEAIEVATVEALCQRWEKDAAHIDRRDGRNRKQTAIDAELARMRGHILPLLAKRKLAELTTADIERFRDQVASGRTARTTKVRPRGVSRLKGGRHAAARTVRLLASIFAWAQEQGLMTSNPARGVRLEPTRKVQRFLTSDEIASLGKALNEMERDGVQVTGARVIRLLMLTGARKSEIESLRWEDIDFERGFLNLRDTKTGDRAHPMNAPALASVSAVERVEGVSWVFPAARGDGHYTATGRAFKEACRRAEITGVRVHDLRHTFASVAAMAGLGLPVIGAVLGHRQSSTTQRYAHIAEEAGRAASDQVAGQIASRMAQSK